MSIVDPVAYPVFTAPPAESLLRLSVEQYHDMARKGILTDEDRVELLEGLLVRKMTFSPAHHRATHRVQEALRKRIPVGYYVASPCSVALPTSEPEPDAAIVRGASDDYVDHHPAPADVALVVEVSDSSLRHDQTFKKSLYARSSLSVYWIVNLVDRRVEVYSDPTGDVDLPDYRTRRYFGETEQVPLVLDGRSLAEIPARELLP
jgi:Uma2 family endonuclease